MSGHKALGRGLEALFASTKISKTEGSVATANAGNDSIRFIAVEKIKPNRHQPRTEFDPAALEELAQSIKSHGLVEPLMVTETTTAGEYELVVGERRLRASKLAGIATVPCTVRTLTNRERFEIALVENLQRKDLNALEEALALDGLMKEYNLTQEQVSTAIGKSRSAVANVLRFLRLHEDVQAALRGGVISEGHAKCLAGVAEHAEQQRLLKKIIAQGLSVRELEVLLVQTRAPRKNISGGTSRNILPETKRYEELMQRHLGRRVEIQTTGKKGWVKLEFYTPEDLDRLCETLGLSKIPTEELPAGA